MNYSKIYNLLIEKADNRCILPGVYRERHHVLPRCMDGSDSKENFAELFPEEHFVAHQLLVKIYPENHKLIFAAKMMSCNSKRFNGGRSKNKLYRWLRIKFGKAMSERTFTTTHRKNLSNALKGKPGLKGEKNGMFGKTGSLNHRYETIHSDKTKEIMSIKAKERHESGLYDSRIGVPRSSETKNKISENHKKFDYIIKCPHCDKEGKYLGMKRWHFDNCKLKLSE